MSSGKRSGFDHPARVAALIYGGISVAGAVAFLLVTTYTGTFPMVARYGGAAWVFLLLMIVLMPIVIPRVRKRGGGTSAPTSSTPASDEAAPEDQPVACPLEEP